MLNAVPRTVRTPLPPLPALSAWEAGTFLWREGWVARGQLAGLRVADVSRRNRVLCVTRADGTGWLLKQGFDPEGESALRQEAAVVRHLVACGAPWAPRCLGWEPERGVLVLELLPGARTARQAGPLAGLLSPAVAAALGHAVGQLHALPLPAMAPADRPIALELAAPDLELVRRSSAATRGLIRRVQASASWRAALAQVGRSWRADVLTHLDLRSDNILLPLDPTRENGELQLVDWEAAGPGDPRGDLALAIAEMIAIWLDALPDLSGIAIERLAPHGAVPRGSVEAATRALFEGYGSPAADVEELAPWIAAALLQIALGRVQDAWLPPPSAERLLTVGEDLAARPREAAARWLAVAA